MSSLKYDPLQTKLTDYYELVNEVDLLSTSNPDLMKAFSNANEERRKMLGISPSGDKLEQIISNAEKNSLRYPHGRRHSEVVKKFQHLYFSMLVQWLTALCSSIGVARGGHGRAVALPSLNFALPSKVSKPSFSTQQSS